MSDTYDVIVVGCGGIGSGVLYHAAKSGLHAIGIDAFDPPHSHGSSHGQTRIIRQAYFEHPDYVPLLLEAYPLWSELEREWGHPLFKKLGLLQVGPREGNVVRGVLESAKRYSLPVESLGAREAEQRFPMFSIPEDCCAAYEANAGSLWVEECVKAHVQLAQSKGASLLTHAPLQTWKRVADRIEIQTPGKILSARKVVFCCGPWTSHWMGKASPLTLLRKQLHWFEPLGAPFTPESGCPLFLFDLPTGCHYGFPVLNASGLKIAEHSGGVSIADATSVNEQLDRGEFNRVERFLGRHLRGQFRFETHSVCIYTMSPDSHFLIDQDRSEPAVIWAGGFSGHGFKFASILGKLLADWVRTGIRDPRLAFLGWRQGSTWSHR